MNETYVDAAKRQYSINVTQELFAIGTSNLVGSFFLSCTLLSSF
jgi:MFS superfamily sulfate permease-like transporter